MNNRCKFIDIENIMFTGTLFIISAPSGAGKSSLINAYLMQSNPHPAMVSISHTTRTPRPGENNGEHYYFIQNDEFEKLIKQDAFIEHATVFGNYYGTSKSAISQKLAQGFNIFLDIDWQGARQVREKMPQAKSIFILPPSITELEKRLFKRGQDSLEVIEKRMQKAHREMSHYAEYDYTIINENFSTALEQLSSIIIAESLKTTKQQINNKNIINQLLK